MKKKRFSVEQIVGVLKQAEVGVPVAEVIRKAEISEQTFYRWKKQYVGLESDQVREMKLLQDENGRRSSDSQLSLVVGTPGCSIRGESRSSKRTSRGPYRTVPFMIFSCMSLLYRRIQSVESQHNPGSAYSSPRPERVGW